MHCFQRQRVLWSMRRDSSPSTCSFLNQRHLFQRWYKSEPCNSQEGMLLLQRIVDRLHAYNSTCSNTFLFFVFESTPKHPQGREERRERMTHAMMDKCYDLATYIASWCDVTCAIMSAFVFWLLLKVLSLHGLIEYLAVPGENGWGLCVPKGWLSVIVLCQYHCSITSRVGFLVIGCYGIRVMERHTDKWRSGERAEKHCRQCLNKLGIIPCFHIFSLIPGHCVSFCSVSWPDFLSSMILYQFSCQWQETCCSILSVSFYRAWLILNPLFSSHIAH